MTKSKKLLWAGFLSAVSLYSFSSQSASQDDITASAGKRPVFGLSEVTLNADAQGCWKGLKRVLTGCGKELVKFHPTLIEALQMVEPFVESAQAKKGVGEAIFLLQAGAATISIDPNTGNLVLPSGATLQNAVTLLVSENLSYFSPETQILLPVVMATLPASDYKVKAALTLYALDADKSNGKSVLIFDQETGNVGLGTAGSIHPSISISVFDPSQTATQQTQLKADFADYIAAIATRNAAIKEGQQLQPTYLPSEGALLKDYNSLIAANPLFKFAQLGEDVIKGATTTSA